MLLKQVSWSRGLTSFSITPWMTYFCKRSCVAFSAIRFVQRSTTLDIILALDRGGLRPHKLASPDLFTKDPYTPNQRPGRSLTNFADRRPRSPMYGGAEPHRDANPHQLAVISFSHVASRLTHFTTSIGLQTKENSGAAKATDRSACLINGVRLNLRRIRNHGCQTLFPAVERALTDCFRKEMKP